MKLTTDMSGSRINRVLTLTERSASLPKKTNVGQGNVSFDAIRNEQRATVQHRDQSRTYEGPKGVLVSRLV